MIKVEFYGTARERTGVATATLAESPRTLVELWPLLAARFPRFGNECLEDGRLCSHLTANLDGARFVTDPATPLAENACVLILSADGGG
jgi:molybdopterin converting factor small subunit